MKKYTFCILSLLFIAIMLSFSVINGLNSANTGGRSLEPTSIPASITLLAGGARWAAQRGNSTLFIDWEDNYLAHWNTDGVNWGPWPSQAWMENQTYSVAYALNQSGLNVHLAGDFPSNLTGYDLLVIAAYWAVEPSDLAMVRDFIANGGGVILLSGVPEFFRCYSKTWWTYDCPTVNSSIGMGEIFGCDGNYFNTGGYANVTVNNPFGTNLQAGDTVIQGAGYSSAAIWGPYNGSQVVAAWQAGPNVAFAYTYQYGMGRVYYQAAFVPVARVAVSGLPEIFVSPASTRMGIGEYQNFTSIVSGCAPTYSYQWMLNGADVCGATSSSWTFTPQSVGSYNVTLMVTGAEFGVEYSVDTALVYVYPAVSVSSISPSNVACVVGQPLTFTENATGGPTPYQYMWGYGGDWQSAYDYAATHNATITNSSTTTFTFTPTSPGNYTVICFVADSTIAHWTTLFPYSTASVTVNTA